ncbi:MAG: heme A synthase [Bdellovibrionaceae bacterium]|nr:heme A synthase [Pseudobdellovibrionaceae bacterium]
MTKSFITAYKILCFGILFLVTLGASVRVMNAGLACPDWPLCFGQIIPDYHPQVYFEFLHRALAGVISLVSFYLNIRLLASKTVSLKIKTIVYFIFIVLLAQIILGGLTVLMDLHAYVVLAHLSLGTSFLSLSFWIYFLLSKDSIFSKFLLQNSSLVKKIKTTQSIEKKEPLPLAIILQKKIKCIKNLSWVVLFVVGVQIILGGLVASHYAALVCTDFPLCQGQFIPTFKGIIGLQVIHRLGAYVTVLIIGFFLFKAKPIIKSSLIGYIALCIFAQFSLGVANVLLYTPPLLAVLHLAVGASLFLLVFRFAFELQSLVLKKQPLQ